MANYVPIYYDDDGSSVVNTYGWTATDMGNGEDVLELDSVTTSTWFMPAEPDTKADGETSATGDRLDVGEKLSAWCGMGTPDAACGTDVKLTMGAATLAAATAISLAAALSF